MDLDYFRRVAPVADDILKIMIAVGWALLLGNLVFQATKSMATGLGFEGEDPKLLFTRTFVFAFLLLVSPEICEIGLGISSQVIQLLQMPTSVTITIPDENNFSIGASWLLIIIIGFVIMWQFVKLCFEVAERYVVTALLVLMAPLAFGMGGSKNTEDIFKGWCRMFGSMCVMMVLNVVFLKLLISALGYVPSGVAVLPWMLLIVGIARVARKVDSIVARMGLNPAITGDGLGRGLPGMVAYAVVKGIASSVAKAAGVSVKQAKGGSAGGKSSGPRTNPHGPASPPPPPPSGGSSGGSGGASVSAGMGGRRGQQANTYSTASGVTFVSQQQGQETVYGTGAVSQEEGSTAGTGRQTGQQGPVKAPTIHTHGTRRSSVPPEARAGTHTARPHTAAYVGTTGPDDKRSKGTLGRTGQSETRSGSQSPITSRMPDQGTVRKSGGSATAPAGGTRISAVTPGQSSDGKPGHVSRISSRESVRERQPIQQDWTPKMPAPKGVAGRDKPDGHPSSETVTHPSAGRPLHEIGSTPASGMAGMRAPAGSGSPSSGDAAPASTAGTQTPLRKSRFSAGDTGASPDTAGITYPAGGSQPRTGRLPSGTAGTAPAAGHDRPLVGGGTPPTGTAGTRRPGGMKQAGTERRMPPSGTAGTVLQGTAKAPGVNRGTRRLKQGGTAPSASGGQTTPPKNRKRRRES